MNELLNLKIKKDILKPVIEIHDKLYCEIKLQIKKDGIFVKTIDRAHAQMLVMVIKPQACEEYYVTEDLELGIDTDKILNFLRIANKNDVLRFSYDSDNNKLIVRLGNLIRTMGLIDTAGFEDPKIPPIEFGSKVIVSTDLFHKTLKSIEQGINGFGTQLLISDHG
ncbi:unnamed protein product, partial [marine sediment metagenome]